MFRSHGKSPWTVMPHRRTIPSQIRSHRPLQSLHAPRGSTTPYLHSAFRTLLACSRAIQDGAVRSPMTSRLLHRWCLSFLSYPQDITTVLWYCIHWRATKHWKREEWKLNATCWKPWKWDCFQHSRMSPYASLFRTSQGWIESRGAFWEGMQPITCLEPKQTFLVAAHIVENRYLPHLLKSFCFQHTSQLA